ncbi:hypothetical protein UFOVP1483_45 [uncultured Caudovirales phage]|uniref:Uncharacterized protein n=1 Tax=uncultured Caudovirales phage TaxID=2100421 RepID=A0A6J5SNW9_9CAUD|nr:hypothetical protein UFOVP1483_45 [uncultured Caudovirales phage]
MKKLFEQLNAMIVEAIMQGQYDIKDMSSENYSTVDVDGIHITLWTGKSFANFGSFNNDNNQMVLTFSDEQKEVLHDRFKHLFERSDMGKKERETYNRLKEKYEGC